ncbi:MAG: 2-oxoacid:acceptor oxidoreductase family protein [Acidobacteria bacterium]|nr:2-oxoacid:acceptor oxidoreductase family protein [Acidobacteriota bacterium]
MSAPVYEPFLYKPRSFYELYERKSGDQSLTHYCPGCGHGELHKMIAEAITDLGIADQTVLISPVGCSVFAYYYFDVGNVQAAHGRAPAVGTGVQRSRPHSIVISYQGDGDLAAIGLNEILQAANRGEKMAVFFVNNAIYGMTGGQMAPTTLPGMATTTSPSGRDPRVAGNPLRMCEMIATLEAPVYVARGALAGAKEINRARKLVRKALETQVARKGFTFVELLSTCPTGWGMPAPESQTWILEKMVPFFPLQVFVDKTDHEPDQFVPAPEPTPDRMHEVLRIVASDLGAFKKSEPDPRYANPRLKIAGFGGQGVLLLGLGIAQCGMLEGRQVSWLPSYGPEMRGGTAHCHVNISDEEIGSPLVSRPTVLMALNQPSVEKFESQLVPGGLLIRNSSMMTARPSRSDVEVLDVPASEVADKLGNPRAANMVMLGAYAGHTGMIRKETCLGALGEIVKKKSLIELNRKAIEAGFAVGQQARR